LSRCDTLETGDRHRPMFRIIDRYIIRELILPFLLGLVVFTFLLMIQPLADYSEQLISKGVSWQIVGRVLATLVPQALAVTIPMSVLVGLLIGLGRLSADRESVALQACGISIYRLLRPVMIYALVSWAATSWVMFDAVPAANQAFREIVYGVITQRVETEIKPRVFFEDFPNRVLYIGDTGPGGTWRDVFLADTSRPDEPTVFTATSGQLVINKEKRTVDLVLRSGSRHTASLKDPSKYEVAEFAELILGLDPDSVFRMTEILKGDNEMTIPELRARAAELRKKGLSSHGPLMALHRKFSLPVACLVFGVIGLALGLQQARGGKLAAFVPGIAVIFAYYILEYQGRQMAKGQVVAPWLAVWSPDLILGAAGVALLFWRARSADKPLRISIPESWQFWRRTPASQSAAAPAGAVSPAARGKGVVIVLRVPHLNLPSFRLLDGYVTRLALKVSALTFIGLLGIFYISTFIDMSDKLFKGQTTAATLGQFFYFQTPQFVFFIIPLTILIAGMVTIGILTKNSEIVVMQACGISLYRVAVPLVVVAALASAAMFLIQDRVLPYSNRRASELKHIIRGGAPRTFDVVNRKWLVARNGSVYNYTFYDQRRQELNGLSILDFTANGGNLVRRVYVGSAAFDPKTSQIWRSTDGWVREFTNGTELTAFVTFPSRDLTLEGPTYFATESPDADRMSYGQLKRYISDLAASGVNVVPQTVLLYRKLSFPFVTLIMTLIAVPFAVTTGRRGAMYGIGVGIVLAISYWVAFSVFAALGTGGVVAPALAAWAPNLLFGAGAAYLLLTVRT
jgi:LPS export ABC transporter permease LptF/LPS export ABC transporter permease LptG